MRLSRSVFITVQLKTPSICRPSACTPITTLLVCNQLQHLSSQAAQIKLTYLMTLEQSSGYGYVKHEPAGDPSFETTILEPQPCTKNSTAVMVRRSPSSWRAHRGGEQLLHSYRAYSERDDQLHSLTTFCSEHVKPEVEAAAGTRARH